MEKSGLVVSERRESKENVERERERTLLWDLGGERERERERERA